jgi:hypothetical protein
MPRNGSTYYNIHQSQEKRERMRSDRCKEEKTRERRIRRKQEENKK